MTATAEVELDIFSGRPNPRWALSSANALVFLERLAALPAAPPSPLAANLGYRGFVVEVFNGGGTTLLRVHGGQVQAEPPATPQAYRDPGRALERWLLRSGETHLDTALTALVATLLPADR